VVVCPPFGGGGRAKQRCRARLELPQEEEGGSYTDLGDSVRCVVDSFTAHIPSHIFDSSRKMPSLRASLRPLRASLLPLPPPLLLPGLGAATWPRHAATFSSSSSAYAAAAAARGTEGRSLFDRLPASVRVVDVSPRDGLQNEKMMVDTKTKLALIAKLRAAGVSSIEAAAFVSPKAVPQMADARAVLEGAFSAEADDSGSEAARFAALVPNLRGLELAAAAGVREATILAAATETMSRRNTNCSLQDSLDRACAVISAANTRGIRTRGAIVVSMVCPYEGDVPEANLVRIAERLYSEGCDELLICDTIGKATPAKTRRVLEAVRAAGIPTSALALHLHDTYGQALANMLVGLQEGVATVDAAAGGLGGCPFAGPSASGNLATEDLVYMLDGLGVHSGIDVQKLAETGAWICGVLGRPSGSRAGAALVAASTSTTHVVPAGAAMQAPPSLRSRWGTPTDGGGVRSGPLVGIRVVELGNFIAGPFCATSLGYYGADVIKVETLGKGDPIRYWRSLCADGQSAWSRSLLRNKRSITVNLKHPDGLAVVRKLVEGADVVVENFRPGVLEKFGLGPDDVRASNPGLIYARISGYGQTGPYRSRPGFASATEGEGGFRFVNGFAGQAPVRPNLSLGDSLAGMQAAFGVVMALYNRTKTGKGQVVDMALYEAVFNMMEGVIPDYSSLGHIRQPSGTTVSGIVPTNTHVCKDGKYVIIGANSDQIFVRVMKIMGREDMATDPRFADNAGRVEHQETIYKVIDDWCASLTLAEALDKLSEASCPAGPIYDAADMLQDPHFNARGLFEDIETPTGLKFKIPAMVPKLSETPGKTEWCGPQVGAHNMQVLGEYLGYSSDEIQRLRQEGAVGSEDVGR